ncbi:hypothetical protein [Streptomyces mirabilis]|uniref:hypothetical protein n=1 Tax=Streptomyces mirabilis TaxID=68239 RepID=UPI00332FB9E2
MPGTGWIDTKKLHHCRNRAGVVGRNSSVLRASRHGAGLNLPESVIAVYRTPELILLALGGLLIAVLGVLLPAGWAARTRSAVALRTE